MRIGIFGGTFDPVHYGHLLLAESCREQLQLDEVRLIPARHSPLKGAESAADGQHRAMMLRLAVAGCPEFVVDERELRREGPSWTVDTLTEFHAEFPDAELFFLMGADSLRDFATWREPARILQLATIAAVNRPGRDLSPASVPTEQLGAAPDRVRLIRMPGTDISATEMRDRIRADQSIRFLTPRAVEAYLHEHQLYR